MQIIMWISRRKMCGLSREDNIINQEFLLKNVEKHYE